MYGAYAVRFLQAALVPSLDDAREAVTLAGADDVYPLALFELLDRDVFADLIGREVCQAELFENLLGFYARLFELTEFGLAEPLSVVSSKPSFRAA